MAFYSKALKGLTLIIFSYEKEMLAIVKTTRKWCPYLLGRPFTVRTDQKSIMFLLEQRIMTPAQARWLLKLFGYEYEIEHKKDKEN